MNEVEIEKRLTGVESKAASNVKRLNRLEGIADAIHEQNVALTELVTELKYTNKAVSDHEQRLDSIERAPAESANKLKSAVAASIISGVIMLLIGAVIGLVLK